MRVRELPPVALTIAGSDSGGGAGIQADLKTFFALGVHGASAVTAVTSQNTVGVSRFLALPPPLVASQIRDVVSDIGCAAARTGMLPTADIIRAVAEAVRELRISPLVVDPVAVATSGDALAEAGADEALAAELLPLAAVLTPNIPEAERLLGRRIVGLAAAVEAARDILALGPAAVLLKGGHADGPATDVLWQAGDAEPLVLTAPRLPSAHTHGTGCVFSAALTAELAKGRPLAVAARRAKLFVTEAIRYGLALGRGRGPVNIAAAARMLPED
jgi:hydroxymethylpyrimidine/phosphomethylpyrimidine kinase